MYTNLKFLSQQSASQQLQQQQQQNRITKQNTQPSISITPLPRQSNTPAPAAMASQTKPAGAGKTSFVICEICDGYIKVLLVIKKKKSINFHSFYFSNHI